MPLDKKANEKLTIPKLNIGTQTVADPNALREVAKMLVAAQNPVIIADRYARSQAGMNILVKLAEALQAPVVDLQNRMNMPTTHYLCQSGRSATLVGQADCILSLEPVDLYGQLNRVTDQLERTSRRKAKADVKIISISTHDLMVRANYQNFQRYSAADISITADAEATLPFLLEAVLKESGARQSVFEARGQKLREA